jgi:glycosyltransferase involved in cell wall biosynthesis
MKRELRICMFTTFYPPHNFGGDGIAVQRLARALARRGHRITVVHDVDAYNALHQGPEPESTAEADGITVERLRSGLGTVSSLLTQQLGHPVANRGRIRRILDEGNFDVTVFHNVSLVGGPGLLREGRGVTLYEAHEHWLVCPTHVLWRHNREACPARQCTRCVLAHRRPPQIWRYTGMLQRELKHVDAFIAKSQFSREKHKEFGFPREMEVIPYFLPDNEEGKGKGTESSTGTGTHAHAGTGGRPYFLFVGRLEKIKGLDDVIPAMAQYPDADLLIAGDGEYRQTLEQLARGVPNVRFLGRIGLDQLNGLYRGAVALVVPSVCFETFGIILIEAFRQGTPVIARRIGPFPEIVDASGGGVLFDSARDLLDAMKRLQTQPEERERMARAARAGFAAHWSESAVLPKYLDLIQQLSEQKAWHTRTQRPATEIVA